MDADRPAPTELREFEVTPEMVEAGVAALWESCAIENPSALELLAASVWRAMEDARSQQ